MNIADNSWELNTLEENLGAEQYKTTTWSCTLRYQHLGCTILCQYKIMILTLTYTVLLLLVINYDKLRVFILYVEEMVEGELS